MAGSRPAISLSCGRSRSIHEARKYERQPWEGDDDREADYVRCHEPCHALKDDGQAYEIPERALHDIDIEPYGRGDEPDFQKFHEDDAEIDQVEPNLSHDRQDDRHGQ